MEFLTWIFQGPFGLRSGWRVLSWCVAYLVLTIPVLVAMGIAVAIAAMVGVDADDGRERLARISAELLAANADDSRGVLLMLSSNALQLLPALAATWLLVRFLDRRDLRNVGLGGRAGAAARSFGWGTGIGVLCIAAGFAALAVADVVRTVGSGEAAGLVLATGLMLLPAAAYEEVVFRGYPFQWLVRALGFWPIAIASSVLFAVVHLPNPNVGILAAVVIAGAGILLCVARVVWEDLWLPIGLHWGWNLAQGVVLGLPISGLQDLPSPVDLELVGPPVLSGAGFGIEGSVAGILALGAGFAGMWFVARGRTLDWRLGAAGMRRTPTPATPFPEDEQPKNP